MLNFHPTSLSIKIPSFIVALFFSVYSAAAQMLSFEGRATDLDSSELLYIENHQVILSEKDQYISAYVTYSTPEGEVFAEKTVDYSKSAIAPDIIFHDKRSDEHTRVFLNKDTGYLQVLIEAESKRKETNIKMDEPLIVVDAGFDRLIESQWNSLRKSKALEFTFLAITRAQLINFEAVERAANAHSIVIELHPRNFFINLLVDPILLEYELDTKRLLRFEGLTNIEKFKGGERLEENYVARIEYRYQSLKPLSISSTNTLVPRQ